MINLPLMRKSGLYDLNGKGIAGYKVIINKKESDVDHDFLYGNYWLINPDGYRYVVKYSNLEVYKISQIGELVFSEFAKMNGVKSAEIDVGVKDEIFKAVISKDVVSKNAKSILVGDFMKENYKESFIDKYSVDGITEIAKKYCENNNILIDDNFREKLLKIVLLDYLTVQEDRNPNNILLEVKDVGLNKVLTVCPMFDNEFIFGFHNSEKIIFKRLDYTNGYDPFSDNYNMVSNESESKFGVNTSILVDLTPKQKRFYKVNVNGYNYATNKLVESELVNEMLKNNNLIKFYLNLKFDSQNIVKRIKERTGIEISEQITNYMQGLFDFRFNQLNKLLKTDEKYNFEKEYGE